MWPLVVLGLLRLTRSLIRCSLSCFVAAVASATGCTCSTTAAVNTNRVYLGTDTRSQCLFIGCALAVGRCSGAARPRAGPAGRRASCGGRRAARASRSAAPPGSWRVARSVSGPLTTSTTSSFPYSGGSSSSAWPSAGVILAAAAAPRSIVPRVLVADTRPLRRPDLLRALHLALADLPLAQPRADRPHGYAALRGARARHVRRLRRLLPPGRAADPHGHLRAPVAGLGRRAVGVWWWWWSPWWRPPPGRRASTTIRPSASSRTRTTDDDGAGERRQRPARPGAALRRLGGAHPRGSAWGSRRSRPSTATSSRTTGSSAAASRRARGRAAGQVDATPSACNGSPLPGDARRQPWPYQWMAAMDEVKPNVVVMLAGRWEVVDREYQGKWTNILNPIFAAYVKRQLERGLEARRPRTGAHLVFLTAPCTDEGEQPDGAPWPEDNPARLAEYNKLRAPGGGGAPQDGLGGRPRRGGVSGRQVHHHAPRCGVPAHRRRPLHRPRPAVAGAEHHAAHRGGRAGPDGGGAGLRRRCYGLTFRGSSSGAGARGATTGLRVPPRVCGLTFGLVLATDALRLERGTRWPSSTVAALGDGGHERIPRAVVGVGRGGQREGVTQLAGPPSSGARPRSPAACRPRSERS